MRRLILFSAIVLIGLGLKSGAWAQSATAAPSPAQAKAEGVASATVMTVHGKIVKVDKARKLVTLEGPEGRQVTVEVRNRYNLDAAKVGAPFVARYYEVVTIRKKKPGESVPSASLKQGMTTARPGGVPGAVSEQHLSLLVTVDAIDEAKGTVTVTGPDGATETVKARNPQNLKRLKVGDQLVVTISRAIGVSLQKEPASGAS